MTGAIFFLAFIAFMPIVALLAWFDVFRRSLWALADLIHEQPSIARGLALLIIAPAAANDWTLGDDSARRSVTNHKAGVSIASYTFTLKVWFEHGGDGIELKKWEQNLLRSAINERYRNARKARLLANQRRHDETVIGLAERLADTYESAA